ncbi:hypothetical protein J3E73DRAFT_260736 [Bipolaris maydis]|nr:hypothetical protein J3E73DRAFT_260736 [Bipolaris maydis]
MPYKPNIVDRSATPPLLLVQRAGTPLDISSPPLLISSPSQAPVRRFHRVKINLKTAQLVRRPQPQVAADVIRHLRGVSALARNAEGFKRKLHKTKAAILAKEERRRRKKRVVESKGGVIYAEDARQMVQQRQVNDLARLKVEIATKRLREAIVIFNKWRRIFLTIRNFGRKYTKRIAASITTQRDVTRWQHINADDSNYNIKALRKWELILQNSSSKYREGAITTDRTLAMWVAYNVR